MESLQISSGESDPHADLARDVVARLRDERPIPRALPIRDPNWCAAFVRAIREHKDQFRGSRDLEKLLRIAGDLLYGKEIHWALELLQNAEDAGASAVTFVFEPKRIVVWNNGHQFTEEDVWGICSAGHSPKRNKIGFFGIGFKSVYKLTRAPEVHSGPFAFRIHDKIYPEPIPLRRHQAGARFVLPLLGAESARLAKSLDRITSGELLRVLLTLRNIKSIRVVDATGGSRSGRFFRRAVATGTRRDELEIGGTWAETPTERWLRYWFETDQVPEGLTREGRDFVRGDRSTVVVARPVGLHTDEFNLHCFLPLDVRSQLRWLIQADFEPTPGRERLRESEWNAWLLGEVGHALAQAVYGEARAGRPPWDLIPLQNEITDGQQLIAGDAMLQDLRQLAFVRTRSGWRGPAAATWGHYEDVAAVVRETDLALIGIHASYVAEQTLGPISDSGLGRAEEVLAQLGAEAVDCSTVVKLLELPDQLFNSTRRDTSWWQRMLDVMARDADSDQISALANTACIPIAGGRVRPSPSIALAGYLVAFSRSDVLDDLQAYFGDSEVYLVDLGRHSRSRLSDPSEAAIRQRIREMLSAEPFNVASEAGPYHVVTHLVLPRMRALADLPSLPGDRGDQLWRLMEYLRQKWPSYVSEYRRWKNDRATEVEARDRIVDQVHVATSSPGSRQRRAAPVRSAYLPTRMLEMPGMDVVLAGDRSVRFVEPIHAKPLRVAARRRRGGRQKGVVRGPVEFLLFLGAPAGPRVEIRNSGYSEAPIEQRPADLEWVEWSRIPPGARNRVGLSGDWVAPDLERIEARWPQLSDRSRRERGGALFGLIQRDWERLGPTAQASAQYFYSTWKEYEEPVHSTWVGRLGRLDWLLNASGSMRRPRELVLDTPQNRSALAGDRGAILRWQPDVADAAVSVGVGSRPGPSQILDTLRHLRGGSLVASREEIGIICRAGYASLADVLREIDGDRREELIAHLAPSFQGNGKRGLIYAPLAGEGVGDDWWPTSRVIQSDELAVVGPFVGQIGGRYRQAARLWDALGVRRSLNPDFVARLIERDLPAHPDPIEAREYYGRLVAYLDGRDDLDRHEPPSMALSTNGWVPPSGCRWTSRTEIADAFPLLAWWAPGSRDPSTLRTAATWLGIREVSSGAESGIRERWVLDDPESVELALEARWLAAVELWPAVLVASAILESNVGGQVAARSAVLRPRTASRIRGSLQIVVGSEPLRSSIEPRVLLRRTDNTVFATSTDELFSAQAAQAVAGLVPGGRLQAAHTLASLLSAALHDPEDLERQVLQHQSTVTQFRRFKYELPPEEPDLELEGELVAATPPKRARREEVAPIESEPVRLLADLADFEFAGIAEVGGDGIARAPEAEPGSLKPPVAPGADQTGDGSSDEAERGSEGGERRKPRPPSRRYSNTEIEAAARPFVARFEASRGCTITRQPPRVGADYRSSDGRYIEVKAFGEAAAASFDLEPYEWRAAQHPQIAPAYWVYVVDHLLDGKPPRVIAIRNPVLDEMVTKQSTGKLRVRGWQSAQRRQTGGFAPKGSTADHTQAETAGPSKPS